MTGSAVKRDGHNPDALINIAAPKTSRSRSKLAGSLRGPTNKAAWRNMMVAALNVGLQQGHFGVADDDSRWDGDNVIYRFDFGGLPAMAYVSGAGFGELSVQVAINPTHRAEALIAGYNAGFIVGDAFGSGDSNASAGPGCRQHPPRRDAYVPLCWTGSSPRGRARTATNLRVGRSNRSGNFSSVKTMI